VQHFVDLSALPTGCSSVSSTALSGAHQGDNMETTANPPVWFKDLGYYAVWFVVLGAVLASMQHFPSDAGGFLAVKVEHALLGAGFGVVCAAAFSALQNGLNATRRKWLSWVLAIATWLGVSVLLAWVTGSFP
jgi:hypothetical protein